MENEEIVRAASKIAAYLVKRRSSKITVETPVVTYDDVREALSHMVPERPRLSYDLPRGLLEELEGTHREAAPPAEHKAGVGIACIPCTVSHVATCAGQLNEAIRFAREDITSKEVGVRVDNCLREIAAAERIDLAPENVQALPPAEKEIANAAAKKLREIRHALEWYKTYEELEGAAAGMSRLQHETSEAWRQARLSRLSPEQAQELIEAARESAQKIIEASAETAETP